jgi:spore germination cell wall hydrolase CwlJ-like protein
VNNKAVGLENEVRRLLEWLDLSPALSGAAHVAAGVFCLSLVSGALLTSIMSADSVAVAGIAKPALASAAAPAASIAVPAVFRTADANSSMLRNAVVTTPVIRIKLSDLERERRCLTESIYFEARGESAVGQLAIAEVILNRVTSGRYPGTICGVVFQGQKSDQCQFSFACSVYMNKPRDPVAWRKAQRLAHYVLSGDVTTSIVGSATYYHAAYVYPQWAPYMIEVAKIGHHIFYRSGPARSASAGDTDPQS